ncbi:hypothetical protein AVEN_49123-1 [Araneus ventricosus]|uniref:Uncharacterized protein n=1 Tax=Araneus ventricosus TaxID=182803 RepID=A0A4Y2BZV9_ARAVE|nr:hypothetical protein AVEN_49123-1 [Araneus ventricosus]
MAQQLGYPRQRLLITNTVSKDYKAKYKFISVVSLRKVVESPPMLCTENGQDPLRKSLPPSINLVSGIASKMDKTSNPRMGMKPFSDYCLYHSELYIYWLRAGG